MCTLHNLLIISFLLAGFNCQYKLKSKYEVTERFNMYPASFAIASNPIINVDGQRIDVFLGSLMGSIIATSLIDNIPFSTNFYPHVSNAIVKWMEWTSAGLIIASSRYAMLINPYNITQIIFTITPNQTINFATGVYSQQRDLTLTALSIGFTIQLYQNQTLILTRITDSLCNSMQFSKQGMFFYYIDNYTRYVINVETRLVVRNNSLPTMQHGAIATAENYDLSASVNLDGMLIIWSNQQILNRYQNSYLKSIIKFTESSQKLITYIYETKTLHIRQKDKQSYSNWPLEQQIISNSNTNQMISMKTVGQKIYVLGSFSILLYEPSDFNVSFLLVAILGVVVLVTCVGFLCFLFRKQKNQLEISYMDQYYRLNSQAQITMNQNTPQITTTNTNTNTNTSSYFSNGQPTSLTPNNPKINS